MNDDAAYAGQRVGRTLCGKYKLDTLLGVGGMAAVYKGVHRNGNRVAIKMLHPEIPRPARPSARASSARGTWPTPWTTRGPCASSTTTSRRTAPCSSSWSCSRARRSRALWERAGGRLPIGRGARYRHQLLDVLAAAHAEGHRPPRHQAGRTSSSRATARVKRPRLRHRAAATTRSGGERHAHGRASWARPPSCRPSRRAAGRRRSTARTDLWAVGATMFTLLSGEMVHDAERPSTSSC